MAIDKAAIVQEVYLDAGMPAKNLIPPTMWSYNNNVKGYPFDPGKAKELLAKAGVKTPLNIDLWYMPVQRPYNPNAKRMAELMQSDLAKIGVNAKLMTFEWGTYRKRMQQGEHTLGMFGWTGDNGDPDNFFFLRGCDAVRCQGSHQALPRDASDRKRRSARFQNRPFHGVFPHAQRSHRLQTKPLGCAPIQRRGFEMKLGGWHGEA
jgi:dipeptide transport system substrate-binding protein